MKNKYISKMQRGGNNWLSSQSPYEYNWNTFGTDYAKQFTDSINPLINSSKFRTGLTLSTSNNPTTKNIGNDMINNSVHNTSTAPVGVKSKKQISPKAINAMSITGVVSDAIGSILPNKMEYTGPKGDITQKIDSVYDNIANTAMSVPGIGTIVGGAMKAGSALGKGINALGGGTDGQTTIDAVLGSSFFNLTPFGLINGFGGKKADTVTKDNQSFETVGASYTGSNQKIDNALVNSGKKYGLFSNRARNKANSRINEAKRQQLIITDIANDTTDKFNIQGSMAAINGNRRAFNMQGGYDQSAIRVGRSGLKLSPVQARTIIQKYQKGKKIQDPFQIYLNSLPKNQRDSTNYRVRDYWEFNDKPKNFKEALSKRMFSKDKKGVYHAKSIQENPKTGEIEYMKASFHPTRYMESDWYEKGLVWDEDQNGNPISYQLTPGMEGYEDWLDFTSNYNLVKSEPYWKYVKKNTKEIQMKKDGGTILESLSTEIRLISPEDILEFQQGGSINVIPNGALHARRHNMENADDLTKKGVPVIDNNGNQQAEIECEEIIYRKSVTDELERLYKIYYNKETSQNDKDECALEAGKLLVKETLYNTQDNTNKLL